MGQRKKKEQYLMNICKRREKERTYRAKRKAIQENYMRRNEIHENPVRLEEELDELMKNELNAWAKEQLQSCMQ